jgi:hypothetical protein
MIVCNNRSFYNDERHQGRMAQQRGRPAENRWIGQHIANPDIDIAGMARMMGAEGIGPVTNAADLLPSIKQGLAAAWAGKMCVVDARVLRGMTVGHERTKHPFEENKPPFALSVARRPGVEG